MRLKQMLISILVAVSMIPVNLMPVFASSTEPVKLLEGRDVGITLEYYGKEATDTGPDLYYGTMKNDKKKATYHRYDSETGVVSIELASPVELIQMGCGYFTVNLGYRQSVKKAPYMAVGMYYYDPEYPDGVSINTNIITNDNTLWGRAYTYKPTLQKHIISAADYTGGKNGGFSSVKDSTYYDYIKISTPITDKADKDKNYAQFIPEGTKLGVQYIAFFDTLEAAQNYEYEYKKPEVEYLDDNVIKVMSYNIRTADSPEGLWVRERVDYLTELIKEKLPDVMGFQECDNVWNPALKKWGNEKFLDEDGNPIYDNTYNYRPYDFNTTNEGDGIFWKTAKFDLIDSGFCFLPYPDKKHIDRNGNFQGMNWVKLKVKKTGKVFYYINTHLSLEPTVRLQQTKIIADICAADEPIYDSVRISNDAPMFVTGDFNMSANSMEYAAIAAHFGDANIDMDTEPTVSMGHWWKSVIDFCFYDRVNTYPVSYNVLREIVVDDDTSDNTSSSNKFTFTTDYTYPIEENMYHISDHMGIMTEIALLGDETDFSAKAPLVSLKAEKDYATTEEAANFTATVEAGYNEIESVSFYVNDVLYEGEVKAEGTIYSDYVKNYTIAVNGLEKGINTVKVIARDVKGNSVEKEVDIEIINPFEATFISGAFAYENESFPIAVTFENAEIDKVTYSLNGVDYEAVQDTDGAWTAVVEKGLSSGKYELVITITTLDGKTVSNKRPFNVIPYGDKLIGSSYAYKHQSSDGKLWSVGAANNYDLKYQNGIKDVLYSAIPIDSIIPEAVKSIKLVTSTQNNGANGWTRFNINACDEFTASSIKNSDGTPNVLPEIGELLGNAVYTNVKVGTSHERYNYYTENIPVKSGSSANYMEFDVTGYVKGLAEMGESKLCIRTSVVNNNPTDTYGFAVNNALVYMFVEYEQPQAKFMNNSFAYENEGFPVAVSSAIKNIQGVTFTVNGTDYQASQNADGLWYAYVEGGLSAGEYQLEANVTNSENKTSTSYQKFTVLSNSKKVIGPSYCAKLQSSDGKIWTVGEKDNYVLRYEGGKTKDVLYTSINLSSLTNADVIEGAYLVTSTMSGSGQGANGWTKFSFTECAAFDSSTLAGGKVPEKLPELGDVIAEAVYTSVDIGTNDEDYGVISQNVSVNGTANYMKLDVTDYIKTKVEGGADRMYLRTSVSHNGSDPFANATNNAQVKLLVKFADPVTVDNFDGTYGYIIDSSDYSKDNVTAFVSEYIGESQLASVNVYENFSGRKQLRIAEDAQKYLMVWDNAEAMKPLAEKTKIEK